MPAEHQRGFWNMGCFNGLNADQQHFLVYEGYLPWGYQPEGACPNPAEVGVETMYDETPGPRFYCAACAITYIATLTVGEPDNREDITMQARYVFESDGTYLPEGEYLVEVFDDGEIAMAWRPKPDTAVVWGPPIRGEAR